MAAMTNDTTIPSIQERARHLFSLISSQRFLRKQGLGNEVPFFICPYPPSEAVEMQNIEKQLVRRLEQHGLRILEIDLYDLAVELLRKRGIWQRILQIEPTV